MAKQSAPGKYYRQGIGLPELFRLFPDDATAEEWFIANRWPEGLRCAPCASPNAGREGNHPQMAHRIRQCWKERMAAFFGPVEVDETYIGGKEGNKHAGKKLQAGRGTVGKTAVAGVKDRLTNRVNTQIVETTDAPTLQWFVEAHTEDTATVTPMKPALIQAWPGRAK